MLVTGGRDYSDTDAVCAAFSREAETHIWTRSNAIVINGAARGLDTLVRDYCHSRGIPCADVPAQWGFYGNKAGPLRNGWMLLLEPDFLMAFPGGKGTADMVRRAKDAGLRVIECS